MPGPISPADVVARKSEAIPDQVFEAVNDLIVTRWSGSGAKVSQADLIVAILAGMPAITREELFARHYLDFEDAYRKVGWCVEYDRPGYNETYVASWTFTKSKS